MTPNRLAAKIRKLRARTLITTEFERVLDRRGTWSNSGRSYTTQKEHWLGWLSDYHGPGYYNRNNSNRSAEFVYNHIVCPPMVLWLGEASGIPQARVAEAKRAALSASPRNLPALSACDYRKLRQHLDRLLLGRWSRLRRCVAIIPTDHTGLEGVGVSDPPS